MAEFIIDRNDKGVFELRRKGEGRTNPPLAIIGNCELADDIAEALNAGNVSVIGGVIRLGQVELAA